MLFEKQTGGEQQILVIVDNQYVACVLSHRIFLSAKFKSL